MNWTNVIGVGAVGGMCLGFLASFWQKIKALLWYFVSLVVVQVIINDEVTAKAVLAYLIEKYQRSRIYDRCYGAVAEYSRDGRFGLVPYEYLGGKSVIFWDDWKPLAYGYSKPTGGYSYSTAGNSGTTVTFFRGTYDVEDLVAHACSVRNEIAWAVGSHRKDRRFFIREIPNPSPEKDTFDNKFSVGSGIPWYQEGAYRLLRHDRAQLGRCQPGPHRALDLLIFPERVKRMIREVQIWRNNRDWYVERGLPWKRGWLLYGPAGSGKTALVRAFAEDLDMPLFVFSLGEIMNQDLQKSWEQMQSYTPCLALFEDLDNVFHGRVNVAGRRGGEMHAMASALKGAIKSAAKPPAAAVSAGSGGSASPSPDATKGAEEGPTPPMMGMLTFDCLLNCIDGARKSEGIFTVITTNDLSKIDPAIGVPCPSPDGEVNFISTRPGRIDKAIELGHMENGDKLLMAQRILAEYPEGLNQMREFVASYADHKETPAQFQERCAQLALSYFWKAKEEAEGLFSGEDFRRETNRLLRLSQPEKLAS